MEVERSLRVLDGAVAVFDAVAGVQPQSETVWRQADKYRVPRIAFINKMDRIGADFDHSIRSMRQRLAAHPVPITYPIGREDNFIGIIDFIEERAIVWKDETLGSEYEMLPLEKLWDAEYLKTRSGARNGREGHGADARSFTKSIATKWSNTSPSTTTPSSRNISNSTNWNRRNCAHRCGVRRLR